MIKDIGQQQEFVKYKKPELQDAPIDKQIKIDLERLLEENKDSFAEDERQIGTTLLIKMSIDTGNHPPIANLMPWLLNTMNGLRKKLISCLKQV